MRERHCIVLWIWPHWDTNIVEKVLDVLVEVGCQKNLRKFEIRKQNRVLDDYSVNHFSMGTKSFHSLSSLP